MVHIENVPFRCNFYEKDLIHESPLNKTKSSVHERKKPYTCFYKKADLNEHISSIHTDKKKLQSVPLTSLIRSFFQDWLT